MDNYVDALNAISKACANASKTYEDEGFGDLLAKLEEAIRTIGRASSNSWIGYQSCVYYKNFKTPKPGDHFSSEWGFQSSFVQPVSENWVEYSPEDVKRLIFDMAEVPEDSDYVQKSIKVGEKFSSLKDELVTLLTVIVESTKSESIEEIRDAAKKLKSHYTQEQLISVRSPKGQFITRDSLAMSQGVIAPPHIAVQCWLLSFQSYFTQIEELGKLADRVATYLRQKYRNTTNHKSIVDGKVFIGHGRSSVWKDLSHFLSDRLKLEWDEFNRESSAGISIKDRLEAMLDQASFAFLIMTAEDEHIDSTIHARENVIHEVGLFQGRLTFKRAIILLEDGCEEFSNIHGVGQIRFPKGNVRAAFEDIRMVLEREGLIPE
ncbi:nucleotide-binding protein [Rheinheimera sp. YQF-2]|uniref:Nucleotide-binding protein n=1 Tax=Rheinheimera lutimaris TaxID=2740584 RepID=A0A7Y5AQ87_9GAMM|nr:TIR domain-containing protein [Rheinheimera lutimaris]NRQ42536.1 nucleotide-binding protein [Rheinheimera lutimaris]